MLITEGKYTYKLVQVNDSIFVMIDRDNVTERFELCKVIGARLVRGIPKTNPHNPLAIKIDVLFRLFKYLPDFSLLSNDEEILEAFMNYLTQKTRNEKLKELCE
jgi:hypothetical protein